jgi:hypothetical protein
MNESIRLKNGAKVILALVIQNKDTLEEGYVLAETETDYVTWRIYRWLEGPKASDTFSAEMGHYHHFGHETDSYGQSQWTNARTDFYERIGAK